MAQVVAPPSKMFRLEQIEDGVPEVPKGRGGKPLHRSFWYRMVTKGKVVNGERVRLQARRVGGSIVTCREWVLEFIDKMSADLAAEAAPLNSGQAHDDATRVLAAAGIA